MDLAAVYGSLAGPAFPAEFPVAGSASPPDNPADSTSRTKHRRTRNGCLPCRKRKKLCDEVKPACGACVRLALTCEWEDKMQAALERRRKRIERMQERERDKGVSSAGAMPGLELDNAAKSTSASPPFDLFALLRSPSPTVNPFASSSTAATLDGLNLPFSLSDPSTQLAASHAAVGDPLLALGHETEQALVGPPDRQQEAQPLPLVSQAAGFLASSDFAFTQSYLLSHYTTSLARLVSIASTSASPRSTNSPTARDPSSSVPGPSSSTKSGASTSASSARASANLFLSLVPLAKRHAYLLHAICSWSAANLAAASSARPAAGAAPGSTGAAGGNPVMAHLSEQLGHLADSGLQEALPALDAYAAAREQRAREGQERDPDDADEPPWEAMLAARLMQTQAAICSGSVELWRVRMRDAAKVVELAGGVRACRTPLARQLVKNLLYHDVLSSTATRDGLLVDYASLSRPALSSSSGAPSPDEDDERDEDEALDTLMGVSEPVFLLLGTITQLGKDKRQAIKRDGGAIGEEELGALLRRVEDIKRELERERERMDGFLLERPDLEPHRYFHETFRLAALLYCEMLLEQPPRALTVLLLVRKMLTLTELIVNDSLPGLPSMHYPLFLMHLNATPLRCPGATLSDRERSTRMFDIHQEQLGYFGNTRRSRSLIQEAWRRSLDGKAFVNTDEVLAEWGWEINYA
ncbi:fungal-specific transcription factor domain-containing protein [Rhodotorula diobovata]|uniref:Fungal-specific transcription factor domain-containing protein n=1 Tax=Rhodotorula diobovata TaxID=5288 RepID=A0A5C5FXX4_9BASI|nr:fungal-specific transcription factor domain-containing protein [Rhodotorula diobovata]